MNGAPDSWLDSQIWAIRPVPALIYCVLVVSYKP